MRRMTRGSPRSRSRSARYRFTRYRKAEGKDVRLELPEGVDGDDLTPHRRGRLPRARPDQHAGERHGAAGARIRRARARDASTARSVNVIVGDDLLKQNFPLIHAVGRAAAADRPPRLIDITWGDAAHPKVTLIGKGVCFDTGGLDIKSDAGMLNMKKDMGGAATMLALAHMLMSRGIKLRLRVLIPAVENSIAGSAFRPRDVYRSRKGITVEIGNTDAEGRLILADAMALAEEEKPELIADMATLTGAARVALGTEVVPFYTDDEALAAELVRLREDRERSALAAAAVAPLRPDARIPRSPTPTTCRRAASPARSPPRCSCAASPPKPRPGCIATSMPGTRSTRPGRPEGARMPGGARALCAAGQALWLTRCRSTTIRASRRRGRTSPPSISKA